LRCHKLKSSFMVSGRLVFKASQPDKPHSVTGW
jgi:hypothetical protein